MPPEAAILRAKIRLAPTPGVSSRPQAPAQKQVTTIMPLLCVYASSSLKLPEADYERADRLGRAFAAQGWDLIFGGANIGIMNSVARAMRDEGRRIVSVIPEIFNGRNLTFHDADEVLVTEDLRERKRVMQERADAFCVFPGGTGTLDEFYETLTLVQLDILVRPIVLLDFEDHFRGTLDQLRVIDEGGYTKVSLRDLVTVARDEEEAQRVMAATAERIRQP
jgi:uncharacterized protein (TIGR00730 family)